MAKDIKRHVTHIKSNVENQTPAASDILLGEIAVNYHKGKEFLSIKNESGDVVTFKTKEVSVTQDLTGGTKIGSISVNGTSTDLYCSGGSSVDGDIVFFGTSISSGDGNTKSSEYVWTNGTQNLTPTQQTSIRTNIGAISSSDVATLTSDKITSTQAQSLIDTSIANKVTGVGILTISACTQSAYDSATKQNNVLYVITG